VKPLQALAQGRAGSSSQLPAVVVRLAIWKPADATPPAAQAP